LREEPDERAPYAPEDIRKNLDHPVIDGDGHWVEYTPVFAEQVRKVTGDLGANGFLQSQRRTPDALSLTLAERTERGSGMEGFWGRQSTNTRDRATAMMPKMLYDRLGELMDRLGVVPSAERLRAIVAIRNTIAHVCPDDPDRQAQNLNEVYAAITDLLAAYDQVRGYLERRLSGPSA
jgi:hypothetical protein